MIRPVLSLGVVVVLLFAIEHWLAERESSAFSTHEVGPLFTSEEAARLRKQPAVRVELSGAAHRYGRIEGRWVALSYHNAPVDARAMQALLDGVASAEGIVYATGSAEAAAFGINTPATVRVSIQGPRAMQDPGGDVQAMLEIGRSPGGREGCFVRKKGTPEIWSIASDLRAMLAARAPSLPPMLEASVVPSEWLEMGGALAVALQRGGETLRLERRAIELDPATMEPGMLPWKWFLSGTEELDLPNDTAGAFVDFLERLPYREVLEAGEREKRATPPLATITLDAREGSPLRLEFGAPGERGLVPLWVAPTLFLVDAATFALAFPSRVTLLEDAKEKNPWREALQAGAAR